MQLSKWSLVSLVLFLRKLFPNQSFTVFPPSRLHGKHMTTLSLLSLWGELGFMLVKDSLIACIRPYSDKTNKQKLFAHVSCIGKGEAGMAIRDTQVLLNPLSLLLSEQFIFSLCKQIFSSCQIRLPGSMDSHYNSCLTQRQRVFFSPNLI